MCPYEGLAERRIGVIRFGRVHRRRPERPVGACCCARVGAGASGSLKRTIANFGALPPAVVDGLRVLLAGDSVGRAPTRFFNPARAAAAIVGMMRKLDLPRLLSRTVSRERDLAHR